MSASRKTDNFNLPLYNADDATSWLVDFNGAMTDIDSSLKQLSDNVSTDGADIDNLEKAVENLNKSVSQLTDSVIKVQENGKSNSSAITLLQTHDNEQDVRLDNLNSDINGLRGTYEKYENIRLGLVTQFYTLTNVGLKLAKMPIGNSTKYDAYLYFTFAFESGTEIKKGISLEISNVPHLSEIMKKSEFETMNVSAWGYNSESIPLEIDSFLGARYDSICIHFNGDGTDGILSLPEKNSNYVCIKISGLLEE